MATTTTPTNAIELRGVAKRYRGTVRPALDHIDLAVQHGEFVFLTGESGSGKSTLMKLLLLEQRVSRGEIEVLGESITGLWKSRRHELRRRIGTVFQDYRLLPNLTAAANVAFALEIHGEDPEVIRGRSLEALELVGLADKTDRLPGQLSGGEQQRVAVARALVSRPSIVLADEPTGNLDPESTRIVVDLLLAINSAGTTVLCATHDTALVDRLGKRVVTLKNGAIVSDLARARQLTARAQR
jgi:cell division transport system ATP-binding protein